MAKKTLIERLSRQLFIRLDAATQARERGGTSMSYTIFACLVVLMFWGEGGLLLVCAILGACLLRIVRTAPSPFP